MADSETTEDPRFRIPRGSSDEEIDSDLASVASADVDTDEEQSELKQNGKKSSRAAISAAAGMLRTGLGQKEDDSISDDEQAGNLDAEAEEIDEDALASVTVAATGRDLRERQALKDAREVLPAGEEPSYPVAAPGRGTQADMMARMLKTLGGNDETAPVPGLDTLKKKVARLTASGKKALPVPLAEPVAKRISRSTAYEQASEFVTDKWADTVQKNRKAKTLSFPMNGPGDNVKRNTADVTDRFKASNEYELEIDQLLKEAGVVNDEQAIKSEDKALQGQLSGSQLSKEEILEKRRELAKMRSLMFHYEHKMKRIKKIKSRKYRKIMKKEKEKLKQMGDPDDENSEDEMLRAERRRAEERMTLRHKNTSKWVRRQLKRGETKRNPEARAAVEEQLQLHQDLKKRQEREVANSDEESESGSEDSIGDDASDGELDGKLDEIRKDLQEREDGMGSQRSKKKPKGLMGMRFMQAAQEKQRKEAIALLEEMGKEDSNDEGAFEDDNAKVGRQSFSGEATKGGKGAGLDKNQKKEIIDAPSHEENGVLDDEVEDLEAVKKRVEEQYADTKHNEPTSNKISSKTKETIRKASEVQAGFTTELDGRIKVDADNPWLSGVSKEKDERPSVKKVQKDTPKEKIKIVAERTSVQGTGVADASNPWLQNGGSTGTMPNATKGGTEKKGAISKKKKKKSSASASGEVKVMGAQKVDGETTKKKRRVQFAEETNEIDDGKSSEMEVVASTPDAAKGDTKKKKKKRSVKQSESNDDGAEEDDDDDMARMSLVAEAFAGIGGADEADFQAAKEAEVLRSLPTAKDIGAEVLPGWGTWDGAGMSKKHKKENEESAFARAARERLESARAKAMSGRKDRKLSHVILDEKRIKQAAELTLAAVPFPFTTEQQWQRELDTPVCRELMSDAAFSNSVGPRVKKKAGVGIEPIRHGAITERRKRKKMEELQKEREEKKKEEGKAKKRRKGKQGVIELRKERAGQRVASRKALMS